MRIGITGASGFIGKSLIFHLKASGIEDIIVLPHDQSQLALANSLSGIDLVFHLAGVNRPDSEGEFETGNLNFTETLCGAMSSIATPPDVVYTSSTQAELDNPYGTSKRKAEQTLEKYSDETGAKAVIFRLPNVFGKWCRPNYNSAVATFCYNIARGRPIRIDNPDADLSLVYIDDLCAGFVDLAHHENRRNGHHTIEPVYQTTVGHLADYLHCFKDSRNTHITQAVGTDFLRALYATYTSNLPVDAFTYDLKCHKDDRGSFVEMLKTRDSGQFSFFTAYPGVTRGGHYHHTKTEKFLVIKGAARFRFRNMVTNEMFNVVTTGGKSQIVETVPGWTHDVTNIGKDELIVMLWANEIYDPDKPDTFACKV